MAVSAPPQRNKEVTANEVDEEAISEIINNGGKTLTERPSFIPKISAKNERGVVSKNRAKGLKGITLLLTLEEAEIIDKLRQSRTAPRGKKIAISFHDWIVEAVQDKIQKEKVTIKF